MTREQFEALVRAEGLDRYVLTADLSGVEYAKQMGRKEAYIAARMEHEWPLLEALRDITHSEWSAFSLRNLAGTALSPYTTKPTEP